MTAPGAPPPSAGGHRGGAELTVDDAGNLTVHTDRVTPGGPDNAERAMTVEQLREAQASG